MASFVAVAPPSGEAEKTIFVRDGFTFLAFLIPVLWFVWHRMWIEAVLALAATLILGVLDGFDGAGGPLLSLLFALVVGLEAPSLRLWNLRRRNWVERAVIEAGNAGEAELRYFLDLEENATEQAAMPSSASNMSFGRSPVPALGFLDGRGIA